MNFTQFAVKFFLLVLVFVSMAYAEGHPGSPCSCTQFSGACSGTTQPNNGTLNVQVNSTQCAKITWHQGGNSHTDFIANGKGQIYPLASGGSVIIDSCSVCAPPPSTISGTIHLQSGSSTAANNNSSRTQGHSSSITINNDASLLDSALQSTPSPRSTSRPKNSDARALDDALNGSSNGGNELDIALASTYTSSHGSSGSSQNSSADEFEQERQREIQHENEVAQERVRAEEQARQIRLAQEEADRQRREEEEQEREERRREIAQNQASQPSTADMILSALQSPQFQQSMQSIQQSMQNIDAARQQRADIAEAQRQQAISDQRQRLIALQNAQRQTSSSNNNSNNYGSNTRSYGSGVSTLNFPSSNTSASNQTTVSSSESNNRSSGGDGDYVPGGTYNSCYQVSDKPYDALDNENGKSSMIKNTCGQALHFTWMFGDGTGSGAANFSGGEEQYSGNSGDLVRAHGGGYRFAICPLGYSPVEADGRGWSHPGASFRCHR